MSIDWLQPKLYLEVGRSAQHCSHRNIVPTSGLAPAKTLPCFRCWSCRTHSRTWPTGWTRSRRRTLSSSPRTPCSGSTLRTWCRPARCSKQSVQSPEGDCSLIRIGRLIRCIILIQIFVFRHNKRITLLCFVFLELRNESILAWDCCLVAKSM